MGGQASGQAPPTVQSQGHLGGLDRVTFTDQTPGVTEAGPDLDKLFPDGEAQQFAQAGIEAVYRLSRILDTLYTDEELGSGVYARLDALEKQIAVLQDTLENTIRTMKSLIEALSRLPPLDE